MSSDTAPAPHSQLTPTPDTHQVTDLDPQSWPSFRDTCHRALDDIIDFIQGARNRPVWKAVPPKVQQQITHPPPYGGAPLDEVYAQFQRDILPYPTGNVHPRFWGWVTGSGTADGVLAEMLAAGLNCNVAGWDQSAVLVEQQVIRWLANMLGWPDDASGLLVSGASMANYIGLAVARNARAGFDVRQCGLNAPDARRLTVYASAETHGCLVRSCELLGLGSEGLRTIPVDDAGRIVLGELERRLTLDRAAQLHPICIIGNAGTVNTGAVDPLDDLAAIARRERIWFHIDGALGALAYLAPECRQLLKGIEQADSLAFDLHKWAYLPYDVGCVLVRHPQEHRAAFGMTPSYLVASGRGILKRSLEFYELGPDLSRSFRALKVWFGLKHHGIDGWARAIRGNLDVARYFAERIAACTQFELSAPVMLNVVAFRYAACRDDLSDEVSRELPLRLQERGIAVVTNTRWQNRLIMRAAIVNHRTTRRDIDAFMEAATEIGTEIAGATRAS